MVTKGRASGKLAAKGEPQKRCESFTAKQSYYRRYMLFAAPPHWHVMDGRCRIGTQDFTKAIDPFTNSNI